jgi:hypothetical protein
VCATTPGSEMSLTGIKTRYWLSWAPSGGTGRFSCPTLSSFCRGCHISWFLAPSSTFKASCVTPSNFSQTLLSPLPSFMKPVIHWFSTDTNGEGRIKENGGGVNSTIVYLIHCKTRQDSVTISCSPSDPICKAPCHIRDASQIRRLGPGHL